MYVGKSIDDETKYKLLRNAWAPDKNFPMPFATRNVKDKVEKRYLRHEHLEKYPALVLSPSKGGLFCRYCVLFSHEYGGKGSHEKLKTLVNEPLIQYHRMFGSDGYVTTHMNRDYHKFACLQAAEFEKSMQAPNTDVVARLDSARTKKIQENRDR